MYASDFEFDNKYLSDFGFVICDYNYNGGIEEIESGSKITFNKVAQNSGKKYLLSSTQYDECITATFDICKNPCLYSTKEMKITEEEYRNLIRWLNRRNFFRFRFIDSIGEKDIVYYNASFNISQLYNDGVLYGIRLVMETDSPFGYGVEKTHKFNITEENQEISIYDMSDEIGFIYPDVKIVCKHSGTLSIKNITENCESIIKNCLAGEVIKLHGSTNIISSSVTRNIADNFNYDYFRIGNTPNNRKNRIVVSTPCELIVTYSPIIKSVL